MQSITINPAEKSKKFILDIRVSLMKAKNTVYIPTEYEGIEGQQGFTNYRVYMSL